MVISGSLNSGIMPHYLPSLGIDLTIEVPWQPLYTGEDCLLAYSLQTCCQTDHFTVPPSLSISIIGGGNKSDTMPFPAVTNEAAGTIFKHPQAQPVLQAHSELPVLHVQPHGG